MSKGLSKTGGVSIEKNHRGGISPQGKRPLCLSLHNSIFLVLLSGILLTFAFPRYNLELLAWLAFVPLFFAIKGKRPAMAFLLSYLCGVVFWLLTVYWFIRVTFLGLVLMILYLAIYFGIFGLIFSIYELGAGGYELIFLPCAWVLLEYLRSYLLTGFGWVLLGYSQYLTLPIIQIADITGAWGVSFLIMAVNLAIFNIIDKRKSLTPHCYLLAAIVLVLTLGYGYYKLYGVQSTEDRVPVRISVIQGNIPQELKWQENSQSFILERYISLSREALKDKPDLIIWPEASSPGFLGVDDWIFENIFGLVKSLNTKLLLGTVIVDGGSYFNSSILLDGGGKIAGRYDKIHLVPFGEYIPLRKFFAFLQTIVPIGDFSAGKEYTVFSLDLQLTPPPEARHIQAAETGASRKFSVLICFEDMFPELSRKFVKRGADFLVNITNDAWFGKTSSPYQHLSASVLRAVENRVFLARAANTGFSGFISPKGEIISAVSDSKGEETFISGYKTLEIFSKKKGRLTFYSRWGDVSVFLMCLFMLYGIMFSKRRVHG